MKIVNFMVLHKLDIIFIQEHNVKDVSVLHSLNKHFHITFNPSQNLKGGTAICIDKRLPIEVISTDMDVEGQIVGLRI